MTDAWLQQLACAVVCPRCEQQLGPRDGRILSVYDHQAICLACKKQEEERPDYEQVSKQTIGQCLIDTELQYGDPAGYCYHHFYPYTC